MYAAGLATMAYYYFDFRDVKKQDSYGLLSSLISQVSTESDSCYNILSLVILSSNCSVCVIQDHNERKRVIRLTRTTLDAHGLQHVAVIAGTGAQSTARPSSSTSTQKRQGATHTSS